MKQAGPNQGKNVGRRGMLAAMAAAAVVVGFNPTTRRWVTEARADEPGCDPIPELDGTLAMDEASREEASSDVGNIVHQTPWAVLLPESVDDVAAMVAYCNQHLIPIAMRGQGHSLFGQSQAAGGMVIDTSTLDRIHEIADDYADVGAGVTWKALFGLTNPMGLTPPALTAYINLAIGGTLSMGGISTNGKTQVDNVRSIQVVTGDGNVEWCSDELNSDLFEAVLTGVGQYAIITRVIVELVPAPERTYQMVLQYTDPTKFFRDLKILLDRNEIENVFGIMTPPGVQILPDPSLLSPLIGGVLQPIGNVTSPVTSLLGNLLGGLPGLPVPNLVYFYQIHIGKNFTGAVPDMAHLLRDMSDNKLLRQAANRSFADFILRIDFFVDLLRAAGLWENVPHLWIDNFLPGETVKTFVTSELSRLAFDDIGVAGLILLLPIRRAQMTRRYFPAPETNTDYVYLFSIMTSAPIPGPNTTFVQQKLARNRQIYERARAAGGKLYPISAVAIDSSDWADQHGDNYEELLVLKEMYDPNFLLTPNVHMFAD
ncbi:MAG: FAD-binding protein [Polyangiaceae bacterium]|nr:FAD-binding protein [Polyangiaceae bacterium]